MRTMSGLGWIRGRQRSLARFVLAMFCLAWLQAAAVPCAMAHDLRAAPASHHDCQYCPPSAGTAHAAADHGSCAFPHDPQVDARAQAGMMLIVPASAPIATLDTPLGRNVGADDRVDVSVPRSPLSISYCRFLE